MSIESNIENFHRITDEAWNKGNLEIVDEIMAVDSIYRVHGLREYKGAEEYKKSILTLHNAFSDSKTTIVDIFGYEQKIACQIMWKGTFTGKLLNIQPTGQIIQITGSLFSLFQNDQIIETDEYSDWLSFYKQIGMLG